jgi:hypothetical protein
MGRRAAALAAVLVLTAAVLLLMRRSTAAPPEPPPAVVQGSEPAPAFAPDPPPRTPSTTAPVAPARIPRPAPSLSPRNEAQRAYLAEMAQARATLLGKFRYPPGSQPLKDKSDLVAPHNVDPIERGLSPEGDGKLRIEQKQSRVYLRPGQSAVASFKITYKGQPTPVDIRSSELVREASGKDPETRLAAITFQDDGVAPDEAAGDGVWTAAVNVPSGTPPCGLNLLVDLSSNGESGRLAYPFIQTGPEPAQFTQQVRVALEDGSVVFYVGIKVLRSGQFEIRGRVYDASGAPSVFVFYSDTLAADATEVRLVAYGKTLLDEGAVTPLTLRDLEGWRFSLGQYPDRDVMDEWACGVVTPAFDTSLLTRQDWNGGDMQERLDALDQSTADGFQNLQSQP